MKISHPTDSSSVDLATLDLRDPRFFGEGDPHLAWHALREREPVRWQDAGDVGFWSVTRHEDVSAVLRDVRRFTSERGTMLNILGVEDPAGGFQMAATDPPRHTQMRIPHNRALGGPALERHRAEVRGLVLRMLQPALDGEVIDVAQGTALLATGIAGTLLGLPEVDWPWLSRLLMAAIASDDPEYLLPEGPAATLRNAHRELFAYLQDHVRRRHRAPGDDMISMLLTIPVDGEPLSPGAVVSNSYSLLLGGMVTTTQVPAATLVALEETGLYAEWARHPEWFDTAIEEALRWSSPVNHFMRYATEDVEMHGRRIRAGEAVVVWLPSANRDERVFPDPYRFDLRREPNRHVTFGYGPHFCVGHGAARLTMRLLFTELFRHFEAVEVAEPPRHLHSYFIGGITRLPVRAHLRARAAAPALQPA
jgi:cytochrome P450